MKTRFLIFLMLLSGFTFQSCKQTDTSSTETATAAAPDMEQVKAEIQALEDSWAEAQNAKNLEALSALYADDAISMPDGAPTVTGKTAIMARQADEFAKTPEGQKSAYTVLEVYGDGETVTEIGTGTTTDASGAVVRTGKYFVVWQKTDGKYLCKREIYNSDAPEK